MKIRVTAKAKEPTRGVFWVVDGELLAFPFVETSLNGVSKSGNTYNHKRLWHDVKPRGCNKPYNYYPRGRVDFSNKGDAIIYINPNIDDNTIKEIIVKFVIQTEPIIREDHSNHYKCYLDDGWKPEK